MPYIGSQTSKPGFFRVIPVYAFNVIILMLSLQGVSFVAVDNVHCVFFLIPLFYWTIYRPGIMPLWFVFLSGLLIDFATDSLLGLHAFSFIVFYMLLFRIRRIILSQPAVYHFVIFAFSAFMFELLRWTLMSVIGVQLMPFYPSLMGFVLNVVAFLPVMFILKMLHRFMSR